MAAYVPEQLLESPARRRSIAAKWSTYAAVSDLTTETFTR